MVQFRPGSHVSKLVALLSFVGEFPFHSLDILGRERVYKALIVRLTQPEHFVNSQTGEEMDCRLFTVTGKAGAKSVRSYKRGLHLLDWVHPGAYSYYMDAFWEHHFPGDDGHRERHFRVAEAVVMFMRAGFETCPYLLPELQNSQRAVIVPKEPVLYLSRALKNVGMDNSNKTKAAFTWNGLKGMAAILLIVGGLAIYFKFQGRLGSKGMDPRGFKTSSTEAYGTAGWMNEKEMQTVLETAPVEKAKGTILGEHRGKAVCMPEDTRFNRHIAVFGASGTMKSRAVMRNALFRSIKRGESVVITDPKAELYNDTGKLYEKHGYEVKVFNLVDPAHGDSWNCMADLHGDTLMAQVLTNVIIGNTSSGKTDHFWDNGEANLLKALILYIDQDNTLESVLKPSK